MYASSTSTNQSLTLNVELSRVHVYGNNCCVILAHLWTQLTGTLHCCLGWASAEVRAPLHLWTDVSAEHGLLNWCKTDTRHRALLGILRHWYFKVTGDIRKNIEKQSPKGEFEKKQLWHFSPGWRRAIMPVRLLLFLSWYYRSKSSLLQYNAEGHWNPVIWALNGAIHLFLKC